MGKSKGKLKEWQFNTIFKLPKSVLAKTGFTSLSNWVIRDTKLGGNAFKLLVVMLASKPKIATTKITMQKLTGMGERAINTALDQLMKRGYAVKFPIFKTEEISADWLYQFYETPTKAIHPPGRGGKGPAPQTKDFISLEYYAEKDNRPHYKSGLHSADPLNGDPLMRTRGVQSSNVINKDYVPQPAPININLPAEDDKYELKKLDDETAALVRGTTQPQNFRNSSNCCDGVVEPDFDILSNNLLGIHDNMDNIHDNIDNIHDNIHPDTALIHDNMDNIHPDTALIHDNMGTPGKFCEGNLIKGRLNIGVPVADPAGNISLEAGYKVWQQYTKILGEMLIWSRDPRYKPPEECIDKDTFERFFYSIHKDGSQRDICLALNGLSIYLQKQGRYLFKDIFRRTYINGNDGKLHNRRSAVKTFPKPFNIISKLRIAHNLQDVQDKLLEYLYANAFINVANDTLPVITLYDMDVREAYDIANGKVDPGLTISDVLNKDYRKSGQNN